MDQSRGGRLVALAVVGLIVLVAWRGDDLGGAAHHAPGSVERPADDRTPTLALPQQMAGGGAQEPSTMDPVDAWLTARRSFARAAVGEDLRPLPLSPPVRDAAGRLRLVERAGRFDAVFEGDGSVQVGGGAARVRTAAVGRAGDLSAVGTASPRSDVDDVVLERPNVEERWTATPDGVQQAWILRDRPAGGGELVIQVALGAEARVDGSELVVGGVESGVRARAPLAWDADGDALAAWYEATDDGFAVVVDDEDADYPVVVDPTYYTPVAGLSVTSTLSLTGRRPVVADFDGDERDDVAMFFTSSGTAYVVMWSGNSNWFAAPYSVTVTGMRDGAGWGASASTGDVNGDGHVDLLVGHPNHASGAGGADEGGAALLLGSATGLRAQTPRIIEGNVAGLLAGTSVSISGDVNDDGFDDVVIGAPGSGSTAGQVFVYLGDTTGPSVLVHQVLDPNPGACGASCGIGLGASVSVVDLNDDGFDDVWAVGPRLGSAAGYAYFYAGSATGVLADATASSTLPAFVGTVSSSTITSTVYTDVRPMGDLDADGDEDYYVNRRLLSSTTLKTEELVILRSSASGPVVDASAPIRYGSGTTDGIAGPANILGSGTQWAWRGTDQGGNDTYVVGDPSNSNTWVYVRPTSSGMGEWTAVGDFGGGGSPQLLVASPFVAHGGDIGRAVLYPSGLFPVTWSAPTLDTSNWYQIEDITGDGQPDYYTMPTSTTLKLWSWTSVDAGPVELTTFTMDLSGSAATTTLGDVNGDGFVDIARGSPSYSNGESGEGTVRVWLGGAGYSFTLATFQYEANQPAAAFGASVTLASDLNDDGYADLVVGAPDYDIGTGAEGLIAVYRGGPGGLPQQPTVTRNGGAGARLGTAVVGGFDLNNDGIDDLCATHGLATSLYVFGGSTGTTLTASPTYLTSSGSGVPNFVEVTGDTFVDMVQNGVWRQGATGGTFTTRSTWGGSPIGDVTGDGRVDAYLPRMQAFGSSHAAESYYSWNGGTVAIQFGASAGLAPPIEWAAQSFFRPGALQQIGDIDDDGDAEVLAIVGVVRYVLRGQPSGISPCPVDLTSDWFCETDGDGDGVWDDVDPFPADALRCGDSDTDTCDDCSSGTKAVANDGLDLDSDGKCDAGDPDDDADGVLDGADTAPLNPRLCQDLDTDTCDDCTNAARAPNNDGPDLDADGKCDAGDPDIDGDSVLNASDVAPSDNKLCRDLDADGCDDCSVVRPPSTTNDGTDTNLDGQCNLTDDDDDGDGVLDASDPAPLSRFSCGDSDTDACDDCAVVGARSVLQDGTDLDADGACDVGDADDDGDDVDDFVDDAPRDRFVCLDDDLDGCDDCAVQGFADDRNDGPDSDGDGTCDVGEDDSDGDGVPDWADPDPSDAGACGDQDGDSCDDCTSGARDAADDGDDLDGDGLCDVGDRDKDGDGVGNKIDRDPEDPYRCQDKDKDDCDDCTIEGEAAPDNDGIDEDGDGECEAEVEPGDTDGPTPTDTDGTSTDASDTDGAPPGGCAGCQSASGGGALSVVVGLLAVLVARRRGALAGGALALAACGDPIEQLGPTDDDGADDVDPDSDEPTDDEPSDDEPSDDEPSDDEPSDDEPSDDEVDTALDTSDSPDDPLDTASSLPTWSYDPTVEDWVPQAMEISLIAPVDGTGGLTWYHLGTTVAAPPIRPGLWVRYFDDDGHECRVGYMVDSEAHDSLMLSNRVPADFTHWLDDFGFYTGILIREDLVDLRFEGDCNVSEAEFGPYPWFDMLGGEPQIGMVPGLTPQAAAGLRVADATTADLLGASLDDSELLTVYYRAPVGAFLEGGIRENPGIGYMLPLSASNVVTSRFAVAADDMSTNGVFVRGYIGASFVYYYER